MPNSAEVMGVPLSIFRDPIIETLTAYQKASKGLKFDINAAGVLVPTPEGANSARSVTPASFEGINFGTLYTIAFKPKDGTGSHVTYQLSDLEIDPSMYPEGEEKVLPRSKEATHTEVHLALARCAIDMGANAQPEISAGKLKLLGVEGKRLVEIGQLGHREDEDVATPIATYTVGFDENGDRHGDPHAVYNDIPNFVIVSAFLALTNDAIKLYKLSEEVFSGLNPQMPTKK